MEKWITFGSGIFMTLVLSATMIGFGRLFQKNPPQEINSLYGYRTASRDQQSLRLPNRPIDEEP